MHFKARRHLMNFISAVLTTLIVLMCFFALITTTLNIIYIRTNVVGYSMLPTLNTSVNNGNIEGDTVYINRFKNCHLGDIIVAEWENRYIIKRLVGTPGDIIQIKETQDDYELFVNNKKLYSKPKTNGDILNNIGSSNQYFDMYNSLLTNPELQQNIEIVNKEICIKLNDDEYFLMGDNWGKTTDSLILGTFNKSEIVGVVDLVVPYGEKEVNYIPKFIFNIIFN